MASVPGWSVEQRRHDRVVLGHLDAQPQPLALVVRDQDDHDLEALGLDAGGQPARRLVGEVVDGGDVEAHEEAVVVAQRPHQVDELVAASGAAPAGPRDQVTGAPCDELAARRLGVGLGASSAASASSATVSVRPIGRRRAGSALAVALLDVDAGAGRRGRRRVSSPVADLLVQGDDGVDAASRGRAGSPGAYTSTGHDLVDALHDGVVVEHAAASTRTRPCEMTHLGSIIWS